MRPCDAQEKPSKCRLSDTLLSPHIGDGGDGAAEDNEPETVPRSACLPRVSLLSAPICLLLQITASLRLIAFFPSVGVSVGVLSITQLQCVSVFACVWFLETHLPVSVSVASPARVSSLSSSPVSVSLSISIRLFISLSRSVLALFSSFSCVDAFDVHRHTRTHKHTPVCLPSLGSTGTRKWDKGGENKQIKLHINLLLLLPSFFSSSSSSKYAQKKTPHTHKQAHTKIETCEQNCKRAAAWNR